MKFVTYNIQYGKGKDAKFDLQRIAQSVTGADVIALQEVSRYMPMAPNEDQPQLLADLLPGYYWVYGPALDVDGCDASKGEVFNRRIQFGNMLLSKTPILASLTHALPKQALVDFASHQRVALEGVISTGVGSLRLYSVHLSPNNPRERMLQVETLLRSHHEGRNGRQVWTGPGSWFQKYGSEQPPVAVEAVVMGDFNLAPDSDQYTQLVGQVDPIYGRIGTSVNFVDAWVRAGNAEQSGVTCPRCPVNDTHYDMRIDYGLVSIGLTRHVRSAWIDDGALGSDHQPVWFELSI